MRSGVVLVLLVSCLASASGCKRSSASQGLPPTNGSLAIPEIPAAPSAEAVSGSVESENLVVSGTSAPVRQAKLGPKLSGVLAAIYVEEGDKVKKGQVLFRLDGSTMAMNIAQAEAALNSATVGRDAAQTDLKRTEALYQSGSIAPAVFDQVKARFDGANAAVTQAQAAVNTARKTTADTAVVSPIEGVVASRHASVGDTVTMMPPTTVLVIQDISSIEVRARVPETALRRLAPGRPMRVRFPALDTERMVPIERINPSVDPMTRTIEVVGLIPNKDGALKAGMLVEVDFNPTSPTAAASASAASLAAVAPKNTPAKGSPTKGAALESVAPLSEQGMKP